ncbi:putative recombination endonuclease subunit D13 [Pectobacterium phage DU_PP_V]|uniref:Putative recombination endonuclease subunit D13 n=1 Tax=Pectobacterium phage DU_PP_V TaxID=2041492 RepID=A0A2D2W711_9CAUD|nr:putative recombination endonuclease subunit D13 [Pectobacterium phage DU_PP_V]ATS94086.1 putative recombination endonuclease subunit D13 [Pectobacterium phage DU_PP_V]
MSKVVFNTLKFSNVMSYGDDVQITFNNHAVTQLVGSNGVGKSTIATVLEEVLYNKNSRGIKKEDLFSWNSDKREYSISLWFTKDNDEYLIKKVVKSSAKVTLLKNGVDISGHTATQTYKLIEEILETDFQTMTKLVYQSVGSSMDFLKTTDAARKNFLVGLLDLHRYSHISDKLKEERKTLGARLSFLEGKEEALNKAIKLAAEVPDPIPLIAEPEDRTSEFISELSNLNSQLRDIDRVSQIHAKANSLRSRAEKEEKAILGLVALEFDESTLIKVSQEYHTANALAENTKAEYKKLKSEVDGKVCPTCGNVMDVAEAEEAMAVLKALFIKQAATRDSLKAEKDTLTSAQLEFKADVAKRASVKKVISEYETYIESNKEAIAASTDSGFISTQKKITEISLLSHKEELEKVRNFNNRASVSNARREVILEQKVSAEKEYSEVMDELVEVEQSIAELDVAILTMKDLVSYKVEYSIKSFEALINHYLSIMTRGEFALGFELEDTKLKVVVFKDGNKTNMENCSTGQQSRISIATLLAIRKTLAKLNKVDVNLLFLDEVVSFIDPTGLETLVELLAEEHELNSVIVSHGRTHPLAHKVSVEQDQYGKSFIEE